MWDKTMNNRGILALAGVVIGFLLSEIAGAYKKYREREDCKNSLLDETRFNHEQTKNKIDILEQAIDALNEKRVLSTKCAKYSTIEFENLYHIAMPKLSILEKDNLRHLNSFYLTIDKLLDRFDESFKNDIDNAQTRKNSIESVYVAANIQLENIRNSLSKSLELSSNLINKTPLPIFNRAKTLGNGVTYDK